MLNKINPCFMTTILSLFLVPAVCLAGTVELKEVLSIGLANNNSVKIAAAGIEQARQNYLKNVSGFLPSISASASSDLDHSASTAKTYSYGLSGSLSLFNGFSGIANVQISTFELAIAEEQYKRAASDAVYKLKSGFINLLWAQESVALSEQILDRRKQNYELIKLKYDAGIEDKGSLLRVEADKIQAEYDLARSKRNVRSSAFSLLKDMGAKNFDPIEVKGNFDIPALTEDNNLLDLYKNTPEYKIASLNYNKSAKQMISARSRFYPDLTLSSQLRRSGDQWDNGTESWSAGLSLSYPLFAQNADYYNLKSAGLNKDIYNARLDQTRIELISDIISNYNSLVDSFESVAVSVKYLDATREQSSISKMQYINGLISYYDWYSVENNFISSERSLLNAKRDALLAFEQWKNLLGGE